MQIVCDKCEHSFSKDIYIEGQLVEEYENIYGTICPKCGYCIKPIHKPQFIKDIELKEMLLKEEILDRLRDKFRRNYNGN